jgi:hypothetical protein
MRWPGMSCGDFGSTAATNMPPSLSAMGSAIVSLRSDQLDRAAEATGIDCAVICSMTLTHYDGQALEIDHTKRSLKHVAVVLAERIPVLPALSR